MAEFPALPLWTDALIGDTHTLTPAEFGAYMRLLITAWRTPGCCIPNDDEQLGRWIGDPKNWHRLRAKVLAFWQLGNDGNLRQKRLTFERKKLIIFKERAAAGGRGKALKYEKSGAAKDLLDACLEPASDVLKSCNPNPNPLLPPNPLERGDLNNSNQGEERPPRANGKNPRALAASAEDEAAAERSAAHLAKWRLRLDEYRANGKWDRQKWGEPPDPSPSFTLAGVWLPKALWPDYFKIGHEPGKEPTA